MASSHGRKCLSLAPVCLCSATPKLPAASRLAQTPKGKHFVTVSFPVDVHPAVGSLCDTVEIHLHHCFF